MLQLLHHSFMTKLSTLSFLTFKETYNIYLFTVLSSSACTDHSRVYEVGN